MRCLFFFSLLVCYSLLGYGSELGQDMQRLCAKAEHRVFEPISPTARNSSDSLLATIARTDDPVVIKKVLGDDNPNIPRGTTKTPALVVAAGRGNWPAIKVLLDAGANINVLSADGETSFERAVLLSHPDIACKLVQHGAKVPEPATDNQYLLPTAALADDFDGAATLISFLAAHGYGIDATVNGDTALHIAAELGNAKLVRLLLRHGANTRLRNNQGDTAETVAKRSGHTAIIRLFNSTARTK